MSAVRILAVYRLIFSALIAVSSVQTLVAEPGSRVVVLLAGTEIAGALMLCWHRTQWLGAGVLVIVFACAQLLHAMQGEWPTRFLLYAASALLIVTMDRTLAAAR